MFPSPTAPARDFGGIAFLDAEISLDGKAIRDLGAVRSGDRATFHGTSLRELAAFCAPCRFLCGHNIVRHDWKYLGGAFPGCDESRLVDTLPPSPLLFPQRPYHRLVKDDKIVPSAPCNPVADAQKARDLLHDECAAFAQLPPTRRAAYAALLRDRPGFRGFFALLGRLAPPPPAPDDLPAAIRSAWAGRICANADLQALAATSPEALAYALAFCGADDPSSVLPPWVAHACPAAASAVLRLRATPCGDPACAYCAARLDVQAGLRDFFGFDRFRTYAGEPLQEKAVRATVVGESILAIFPTGGGKSLTFQLPALMAGRLARSLTVVVSPLQSLMKDQVDHLAQAGIADAVAINGLLSPLERSEALERVRSGLASLLYISPEQLRSRTVETLLASRTIARFVIDEAHCFSAWGQDFRVDYLFIAKFIRTLQAAAADGRPIPVSCFTATAKPKVVQDIRDYFRRELELNLRMIATSATRENLRYQVIPCQDDKAKYATLRNLLEAHPGPAIVYASRTRRTVELADRLSADGLPARPFNGKMDPREKVENQNAFLDGRVRIMVATAAFGMGVDKKDVALVVHYDISDSLENYVQEAGRAGRDPSIEADCCILFNESDLDKHFTLLAQTKLSLAEINQVWTAVKSFSAKAGRDPKRIFRASALELAREAGWSDLEPGSAEIETRIRTALAALEKAGYLERRRNCPRIFATGILARTVAEAREKLRASPLFDAGDETAAVRILAALIGARQRALAGNRDAESRVDYIADNLGLPLHEVIRLVALLRQAGILEDAKDMTARLTGAKRNDRLARLRHWCELEARLARLLPPEGGICSLKRIAAQLKEAGAKEASPDRLRTLLFFWTITGLIQKAGPVHDDNAAVRFAIPRDALLRRIDARARLAHLALGAILDLRDEQLAARAAGAPAGAPPGAAPGAAPPRPDESIVVAFSFASFLRRFAGDVGARPRDLEEALLFLSKANLLQLEGGFLVSYNAMEIRRLELTPRLKYRKDDYRDLDTHYAQKIQQIHIVGEYARLMVRNPIGALAFVHDYFNLPADDFLRVHFKGDRRREIRLNMTPACYRRLFGTLSETQRRIIEEKDARRIVVAAGPGSGKTRLLVHKMASLLQLEDVKHEQLLMLTFSRAAASEFRRRLLELTGAARFIEARTFHSFAFDLLGRMGSLRDAPGVVDEAVRRLRDADPGIEPSKLARTVLLIDEAQDMDAREFALVEALMERNPDMRVIAVGDDDQNIYAFRGSDSKHLRALLLGHEAAFHEMAENFRSAPLVVDFANRFASSLAPRLKTRPLVSKRADVPGRLRLVRHRSSRPIRAFVRDILATAPAGAAVGILAETNEDALLAAHLLRKQSRWPVRLAQDLGHFALSSLPELRLFLDACAPPPDAPLSATIPEPRWAAAIDALRSAYAGSSALPLCLRLLDAFRAQSPRPMHWTDLSEFLDESRPEDASPADASTLLVSTIHKAKGREFDVAYVLFSGRPGVDMERRRAAYVAFTRARDALSIHLPDGVPLLPRDALSTPGLLVERDDADEPPPDEFLLSLTHRDVHLGRFAPYAKAAALLRAGAPLEIDGNRLLARLPSAPSAPVHYSAAFRETLARQALNGYRPVSATIRYVVLWTPSDAPPHTPPVPVVLPDLVLRRDPAPADSACLSPRPAPSFPAP